MNLIKNRYPAPRPLLPLPPRTNAALATVKGGIEERDRRAALMPRITARLQEIAKAARCVARCNTSTNLTEPPEDVRFVA